MFLKAILILVLLLQLEVFQVPQTWLKDVNVFSSVWLNILISVEHWNMDIFYKYFSFFFNYGFQELVCATSCAFFIQCIHLILKTLSGTVEMKYKIIKIHLSSRLLNVPLVKAIFSLNATLFKMCFMVFFMVKTWYV